MSIKFPRFVFRSPGKHACQGGTYDHMIVADADTAAQALCEGWYPTLPEAVEAAKLPPPPVVPAAMAAPEPDLYAPPTREEMEAKAEQLGILDRRWSDRRLMAEIERALAERGQ